MVNQLLSFDLNQTKPYEFLGFGTQIWGYNTFGSALLQLVLALNIRYVRLSRESASWEQLQATWQATNTELGTEWILTTWRAQEQYCDSDGMLADVSGFASWWIEEVMEMDSHGMRPHYIELMNEPDSKGGWSTGIAPHVYNDLVKTVRRELDSLNFTSVGILGPGCTHLNWEESNKRWIQGLDDEAVRALGGWSSHTWDDGDLGHGGPVVIEKQSPCFVENAISRDAVKPRFITEYATKEKTFDGRTYPNADGFGSLDDNKTLPYYSVTACIPYATCVYENTLALLNSGIQAPFVWQLTDEPSEVYGLSKSWGLVDLEGNHKPVYDALSTLFPKIPIGAHVIEPPQQNNSAVYSAVFVKDDSIVVALANRHLESATAAIVLTNVGPNIPHVTEAVAFLPVSYGNIDTGTPGEGAVENRRVEVKPLAPNGVRLDVQLQADSTLTIVLSKREMGTGQRERRFYEPTGD